MSVMYIQKEGNTDRKQREKGIETTVLCGDQNKTVAEQWQIKHSQHPWKDIEREDAKRVACFLRVKWFFCHVTMEFLQP